MAETTRTMYMHTLDGRPAGFGGKRVYYAGGEFTPVTLVASLATIRRQREADRRDRKVPGDRARYGYARVRVKL